MEIGINSFAALNPGAKIGRIPTPTERLATLREGITLADRVGIAVFGVGEHRRPNFADASPTVILAAAAARTNRIRLTSAVSVLSTVDPVRLFQAFATVDLLSKGRAEIVVAKAKAVSQALGGISRISFQMSAGNCDGEIMARSIELIGRKVAPLLRQEAANSSLPPEPTVSA